MMPKTMPMTVAANGTMKNTAPTMTIRPQTPRTYPITAMIDHSSWKFSAATACWRTVGDCCPRASIAMSGASQPRTPPEMSMPAAPPKCAMSAQALSSLLAYPGGGWPGPAAPGYVPPGGGPYPVGGGEYCCPAGGGGTYPGPDASPGVEDCPGGGGGEVGSGGGPSLPSPGGRGGSVMCDTV